nr:hypothetical protein [Acidobacteriota bacterium]
MRLISYLVVIATAVLVGSIGCANPDPELAAAPAHVVDIDLPSESTVKAGTVPRNATFASLLESYGLSNNVIAAVVNQTSSVFDPRRLRAANNYEVVMSTDGNLVRLKYHIDSDSFLRIQRVGESRFQATIIPYVKERAVIAMSGEI